MTLSFSTLFLFTAMPFFTAPTSFRRATQVLSLLTRDLGPDAMMTSPDSSQIYLSSTTSEGGAARLLAHSSHPNFGHLTLLVLEAVLEVVCVSLPGYILARRGLFNPEMQKFAANLNVLLFTPCLSKVPPSRAMAWLILGQVFTKLASQLTAETLADLAIIPLIYVVQVGLSYICAVVVAKAFGFSKRPRNFVIAMGVQWSIPRRVKVRSKLMMQRFSVIRTLCPSR